MARDVNDIVVQRYIESRGDKAHIIRLIWNLNSPASVQFIHSNVDYKGTICRENRYHSTQDENRKLNLERDRYLVTENSTIIPSQLTNATSYLKQQILAIKELIENYLLKDSVMIRMTVDFIQDSMQRYHFIKIRNYRNTQKQNTRSFTKNSRTALSECPSMPDICIHRSSGSRNLKTPISEYYFRNTNSEKVSIGSSPKAILTKRTLSVKNLRLSTANTIRVKYHKPNSPPYVYNKEHEKELQLDDAVDNLLSYKSTLIKHLNYRKWIQRRNESQPILPQDKLFANKLSVHLDTIKKQAENSHSVMANMLDTMYRLTEGRYLTVTFLIKETMKFLLERVYSKKERFRSGSQLQKYNKIEEKYQKILNQKMVQSSDFRAKQQIDDGARTYDDVMKRIYSK